MGCGGSKEEENPDQIKFEMKTTKIGNYDSFFTETKDVLKNLEELRAAFQDSRDKLHQIARSENLKEPTIIEAFRVFFWSVSAHKQGKVKDAGPSFSTDPISITVNCEGMDPETVEFAENAKTLMGGVTSGPEKVVELVQKLIAASKKAEELAKTAKQDATGAGLNPFEAAQAAAYTALNIKTVAVGLTKAKNVAEQVKEGATDLKSTIAQLKKLIDTSDEVGKKASEAGHLKISEIFEHYQTLPKKTPEELAAEKKAKKSGKKPEKKKADAKAGDKSPEKKDEKKEEKKDEKKEEKPEEKKEDKPQDKPAEKKTEDGAPKVEDLQEAAE